VELALLGPSTAHYTAPALGSGLDLERRADIVWWTVGVGFMFTLAIGYAAYCRATGGDADISFSIWSGFKVSCKGR